MRWDADNAEAVMAVETMRISRQSPIYWQLCLQLKFGPPEKISAPSYRPIAYRERPPAFPQLP